MSADPKLMSFLSLAVLVILILIVAIVARREYRRALGRARRAFQGELSDSEIQLHSKWKAIVEANAEQADRQ